MIEDAAPLAPGFYRGTVQRIRAAAEALSVDGFLLLESANLTYATGFFHHANERPMGVYIPVAGEPILLLPQLEQENAASCWIADLRTYPEFPGELHPVLWMLRETGARRLAVDSLEARLFQAAGDVVERLVLSDRVERLRFVKSDVELALVRLAARYADACLDHMRRQIGEIVAAGGSELDIQAAGLGHARALMSRELGSAFAGTKLAVVGSVHSGPRAALPHGQTLPRRPQKGEPIIAGIGATVGGYHAESGATFVLGEPSADVLRCLRAADACNAAGVRALRPGRLCQDVNRAALAELEAAGLAAFIRHRLGHGMGVEGHEAPWLAQGDRTVLQPGMVFSNEPGIYRPSIDGYRTIDTMIVTEQAAELPSRFQQDFGIEQRILG
jgi:Xaa-Pro aminopeptidase